MVFGQIRTETFTSLIQFSQVFLNQHHDTPFLVNGKQNTKTRLVHFLLISEVKRIFSFQSSEFLQSYKDINLYFTATIKLGRVFLESWLHKCSIFLAGHFTTQFSKKYFSVGWLSWS